MKPVVQYNHALNVIQAYKLEEPLSKFLGRYFKENPQMGSKDRKFLRTLVYQYFRLGHAQDLMPPENGLIIAHFLGTPAPTDFLEYWLPQVSTIPIEQVTKNLEEKLILLREEGFPVKEDQIFPLKPNLSHQIDASTFVQALLCQPPVYIRLLNSEDKEEVTAELREWDWDFEELSLQTFALPQNAPVNQLKAFKAGQFMVMDRSVQMLADYLPVNDGEQWWDCCAGAGGKSLLLQSLSPKVKLWATDNRNSILKNHQKRMEQHGTALPHYAQADLEKELPPNLPVFDGILMDAPCSGSGTWLRTPEGIRQYGEKALSDFQARQIRIASQVLSQLKPGGKLVYITCSAFVKENEEVVQHLQEKHGLHSLQQTYIKGYEWQAETLFVAVLEKGD